MNPFSTGMFRKASPLLRTAPRSARIQALSKQQAPSASKRVTGALGSSPLAKVELKREIKEHFGRAASLMVARKAQDMSGGQIPGNAPTVRSFVVPRFK